MLISLDIELRIDAMSVLIEKFLLSLTHVTAEKVFGSNYRNGEFRGFTRYDDQWIQKSHF